MTLALGPPSGTLRTQARSAGRFLSARLRAILAACRRRWVAQALYAELSQLSDADLRRLGLSRSDLYRWVKEAAND